MLGAAAAEPSDPATLALLDLPDDLLLRCVLLLPQPHAAASSCQRLCRLMRVGARDLDVLCAWPNRNFADTLQTLLQSMPHVARVNLLEVPRWIAGDPAALADLRAARRAVHTQPDTPLWLEFVERSITRAAAAGLRGTALTRNCRHTKLLYAQVALDRAAVPPVPAMPHPARVPICNAGLRNLLASNARPRQLDARDMLALTTLTALRDMDLGQHELTEHGAHALPAILQLRRLSMSTHDLTPRHARALAALTALQQLDLGSCRSCKRIQRYEELRSLTQLTHLSLRAGVLALEQARALASLTALQALRLHGCSICDAGGASLLASMPRLWDLDLSDAGVGIATMLALFRLTGRLQPKALQLPVEHYNCMEAINVNIARMERVDSGGRST